MAPKKPKQACQADAGVLAKTLKFYLAVLCSDIFVGDVDEQAQKHCEMLKDLLKIEPYPTGSVLKSAFALSHPHAGQDSANLLGCQLHMLIKQIRSKIYHSTSGKKLSPALKQLSYVMNNASSPEIRNQKSGDPILPVESAQASQPSSFDTKAFLKKHGLDDSPMPTQKTRRLELTISIASSPEPLKKMPKLLHSWWDNGQCKPRALYDNNEECLASEFSKGPSGHILARFQGTDFVQTQIPNAKLLSHPVVPTKMDEEVKAQGPKLKTSAAKPKAAELKPKAAGKKKPQAKSKIQAKAKAKGAAKAASKAPPVCIESETEDAEAPAKWTVIKLTTTLGSQQSYIQGLVKISGEKERTKKLSLIFVIHDVVGSRILGQSYVCQYVSSDVV